MFWVLEVFWVFEAIWDLFWILEVFWVLGAAFWAVLDSILSSLKNFSNESFGSLCAYVFSLYNGWVFFHTFLSVLVVSDEVDISTYPPTYHQDVYCFFLLFPGSSKEWANDWTILGAQKWVDPTNLWAYLALAWNTAFIKKDSDPPFLDWQFLALTYHKNV